MAHGARLGSGTGRRRHAHRGVSRAPVAAASLPCRSATATGTATDAHTPFTAPPAPPAVSVAGPRGGPADGAAPAPAVEANVAGSDGTDLGASPATGAVVTPVTSLTAWRRRARPVHSSRPSALPPALPVPVLFRRHGPPSHSGEPAGAGVVVRGRARDGPPHRAIPRRRSRRPVVARGLPKGRRQGGGPGRQFDSWTLRCPKRTSSWSAAS